MTKNFAPPTASFFGTTRNVPLARAITTSSALIRLCAKQIVLPVLITSVSTASHCPTWALPMKSTASLIGHQRISAAHLVPQLYPIALSASAAISPPWNQPRQLVCGVAAASPMITACRPSNRAAPRDR
jgi:hypothetical protein